MNRKSRPFQYETLVDFSQCYLFIVPTDLGAKSAKSLPFSAPPPTLSTDQ